MFVNLTKHGPLFHKILWVRRPMALDLASEGCAHPGRSRFWDFPPLVAEYGLCLTFLFR